jgi:REP element-mobilizing transposase RayT
MTLCTKNRSPTLTEEGIGTRMIETLFSLHGVNDMALLAATAMPDHAHLLLERFKLKCSRGR